MNILHIIIISYLAGVSIAAFTLLTIQKKEYRKLKMRFIIDNNIKDEPLIVGNFPSENKEKAEPCKETEPEDKKSEKQLLKEYDKYKLTKEQSDDLLSIQKKRALTDSKLWVVSGLGGCIAMYIGMFLQRFKLKNIAFMVLMPVLCGLYIFLLIQVFTVWIIL